MVLLLFQGGSVLLLTGPPGCGKTATVQILVQDLGIQVHEWINPVSLDFTKEDFKESFNQGEFFGGGRGCLLLCSNYSCSLSALKLYNT